MPDPAIDPATFLPFYFCLLSCFHPSLSWAIGERRRRAFFLFLLPFFLRVAARERAAAEGLDDEEKENDFS